jgi:hypothetical protein
MPVLVVGPYLVRTASLSGNSLSLTGDVNATTSLLIFGPSKIRNVEWNGKQVKLSKTSWGALQAVLPGPNTGAMSVPDLRALKWKYTDSLPEIQNGYDDAKWVKADLTNTTSNFPRYYGGPWNLSVASDYGYHARPTPMARRHETYLDFLRSGISFGAATLTTRVRR